MGSRHRFIENLGHSSPLGGLHERQLESRHPEGKVTIIGRIVRKILSDKTIADVDRVTTLGIFVRRDRSRWRQLELRTEHAKIISLPDRLAFVTGLEVEVRLP